MSMRHGIDDVVDSEAVRRRRHGRRIMRVVGMLPGIAHVAVVVHRDHEPAAIVVDAAPVRRAFHAAVQMPLTGDLRALVELEQDVMQHVVVGNVDDRAARQERGHRLAEPPSTRTRRESRRGRGSRRARGTRASARAPRPAAASCRDPVAAETATDSRIGRGRRA